VTAGCALTGAAAALVLSRLLAPPLPTPPPPRPSLVPGEKLKGKVAVISGGGSGLGLAMATAFVAEGARVVIAARNRERLQAAASTIGAPAARPTHGCHFSNADDWLGPPHCAGGNVLVVPCDVTDPAAVERLFATAEAECGQIGAPTSAGLCHAATLPHCHTDVRDDVRRGADICVNNSGLGSPGLPPQDLSVEQFTRVLSTNVTGVFLCAQQALRRMIPRRQGKVCACHSIAAPTSARAVCAHASWQRSLCVHLDAGPAPRAVRVSQILNVGSISAQMSRPNALPYTTSKYAVEGLTRSLALDARAHGIEVSVLHPGNAETAIFGEKVDAVKGAEGMMDPADVAQMALAIVCAPSGTNVLSATMLPTRQPYLGRG
jgi:NAD(P)-dependent dehydrogenase (short-subunit alcohol dehydrogenase family)